jgi:hypothetical protein
MLTSKEKTVLISEVIRIVMDKAMSFAQDDYNNNNNN